MTALHRPWTDERITWTARQREVLGLMAKGRTNPEIAEALGVSLAGAKWHVSEVMTKLGVSSRDEAAEYWREQNRLPRRFAVAMRGLFGAGMLKTAAVGAAAATVVAGGAAATLVVLEFGHSQDQGEISAPALPPPLVPHVDLTTRDGLTMSLVSMSADDTLTTVDVVLEGRPELGRFASPGLKDSPVLSDQAGTVYRAMSMRGFPDNTRRYSFTFAALAPSATELTMSLHDAQFVSPAAEVPEGQRPPDPSATVAGPWVISISGFTRQPAINVAIDGDVRAFGPGFIVLDAVIQAPSGTVIRAHVVGVSEDDLHGLLLFWKLTDSSGAGASPDGGGGTESQIEQRFSRTTGAVTLQLIPSVRPIDLIPQTVILAPGRSASPTAAEVAARNEARALTAARLAEDFAGAGPIVWSFTLPD